MRSGIKAINAPKQVPSGQAHKDSETRYRRLFETAQDGILILDAATGFITDVNPFLIMLLGYSREEFLGKELWNIGLFKDIESFKEAFRELQAKQYVRFEDLPLKTKDGRSVNVEFVSNVYIESGRGVIQCNVRDITNRKREEGKRRAIEQQFEQHLRQAQKMEAVGGLASGIAHDFNNLLMVIQAYTEMLQSSLSIQDSLRRNTEQVLKAAERGASLTRQLLAFSRKQIISPVVLDLNTLIDETAKMLRRIIGEDIELRVALAEPLWAIEADPDQIVQVLMNLCVNSRDAMPQGGVLTITTENMTVDEGGIGEAAYVAPGNYVLLSVTDTGTGIDKGLQEQIFEPFFTTKEVGKGTGLGLAMVYGIVEQSGGYVRVDSKLGLGACFTVYLPKVERAIASKVSAGGESNPQGTETLLVVEDEEFIRTAICEFLRSLGYTVFAASSGQEALLVASQQEHIDLLLTDVVMPKMSGRELSQMLGSLRPHLKTIFMSGYTDDAVLRNGVLELSTYFLQKPFSLGTLARKVSDTLGREPHV